MTHEEQNLAVAQLHGFTDIRISISWEMWDTPPSHRLVGMLDGFLREVPKYTQDLNACHEVEVRLPWALHVEFERVLRKITETNTEAITFCRAVSATAEQRVEALLRTAGKWRDA